MSSLSQRFWKVVGESGVWKAIGAIHTTLYRSTGGRVGHAAGHLRNLLLTTRGRKTGEARTSPLTYLRDGDDYVLVASNGGADRHPAWWLNLSSDPAATIQVGTETIAVTARGATLEERARLWPKLKEYNPFYATYEQITAREIPVVILRPRG